MSHGVSRTTLSEGSEKGLLHGSQASGISSVVFLGFIDASLQSQPLSSHGILPVCWGLSSPLLRTPIKINAYIKNLLLTRSVNTLFSHKVIFTGTRSYNFNISFCGHNSILHKERDNKGHTFKVLYYDIILL